MRRRRGGGDDWEGMLLCIMCKCGTGSNIPVWHKSSKVRPNENGMDKDDIFIRLLIAFVSGYLCTVCQLGESCGGFTASIASYSAIYGMILYRARL
jgi:hypothetical protein